MGLATAEIQGAETVLCVVQLMQVGDTIEYAKVTDGLKYLERPVVAQAPKTEAAPTAT